MCYYTIHIHKQMKTYKQFEEKGTWYKANFHAHSTVSDGLLSPEEMIKLYKEHHYSILMFSEHEQYTNTTEYDSENFIVYPGIERSIQLPNHETFHIQGIFNANMTQHHTHQEYIEVPEYTSLQDVQKIIDELKEHGNFVMINHPYWSFNTFQHLHDLKNYDFIEIYNHNCKVETDLGESEVFVDEVLKERQIKVLSTDDNHNSHRYQKGIHMWDSFGGFTMIQANELTRASITQALQNGLFYASTGVELFQFGCHDETIYVNCSPCNKIIFKAWPRRGYTLEGSNLTYGEYQLRGGEQWIRVKCINEFGQCAWSNPIDLHALSKK